MTNIFTKIKNVAFAGALALVAITTSANAQEFFPRNLVTSCDTNVFRALDIVMNIMNMEVIFHGIAEQAEPKKSSDLFVFANKEKAVIAVVDRIGDKMLFCFIAGPEVETVKGGIDDLPDSPGNQPLEKKSSGSEIFR